MFDHGEDSDNTDVMLGMTAAAAPNDTVVEVAAPAPASRNPVETATLEGVDFIDEDANEELIAVNKPRAGKTTYRTKIKTIAGIPIATIARTTLAKFCVNNGLKNAEGNSLRTSKKHEMCERIVQYVDDPDAAKQFTTAGGKETGTVNIAHVS